MNPPCGETKQLLVPPFSMKDLFLLALSAGLYTAASSVFME
jgi:hypothetical protein